jgi:hypothetical protein
MPLFSVIIPAYNRADLIGATIDSVLAQEFTDWEMIVVDDGSTDATSLIVSQYSLHHPGRITALEQPNAGPGAARNLALQHSTGRYVVFLDSDDLWFPWTLAIFRRAIDQFEAPTFIAGREVQFHTDAEIERIVKTPFEAEHFVDYFTAESVSRLWIVMGAVAIGTDALRTAGGFAKQQINAEDTDLWLKLGCSGGFVKIVSPPLFGYRQHAGSAIACLEKTYLGMVHMIDQESNGRYPGGQARQLERRRIVAEHLRPVSVECLRQKRFGWGFHLYRRSFGWQLRFRRFKYLAVFPIMAAVSLLRPKTAPPGIK